jgi:hypothetical protein
LALSGEYHFSKNTSNAIKWVEYFNPKNQISKITFSLLTGGKWCQIKDKDFIDLHQKWWIEKEELKSNLTGSNTRDRVEKFPASMARYLANTESRSEGWRMVDMIFRQ